MLLAHSDCVAYSMSEIQSKFCVTGTNRRDDSCEEISFGGESDRCNISCQRCQLQHHVLQHLTGRCLKGMLLCLHLLPCQRMRSFQAQSGCGASPTLKDVDALDFGAQMVELPELAGLVKQLPFHHLDLMLEKAGKPRCLDKSHSVWTSSQHSIWQIHQDAKPKPLDHH